MIVYDLRTNNIDIELIKEQYADQVPAQLGKDGAFWKWLGEFATGLLNNASDILNSIYGGATADNISYVTYTTPNADAYNQQRQLNTGSSSQNTNMLMYLTVGGIVLLGGIYLITRDKKRR